MAVLAVLIGVVVAVIAAWLLLVFVVTPVVMISATAGALVGVAVGLVGAARGLSGSEDSGWDAEMPEPARPRGPGAPYPTRDDAWPHYLTGQLLRDVCNAAVWPGRLVGEWWRDALAKVADGLEPMVLVPAAIVVTPFLVAVTAGTVIVMLTVLALGVCVALAGWAVGLVSMLTLRPVDYATRWLRRAAVVCPDCRWVSALPAFRCRSCDRDHHDVRPGPLGLWYRRCRCGGHMPTMVLRAIRTNAPVCPRCGTELLPSSGVVPELRVALSGGPQTGKTFLLRCGMPSPTDNGSAPIDAPEPNRPGTVARPVLSVTTRRLRPCRVRLFDAAGDMFLRDWPDSALHHLGTTRNHILVIDPLALPGAGGAESPIELVERPYRLLVSQIRQHGMRTSRCSLAVTVAKMDLLWTSPVAHRLGLAEKTPPRPRAWLQQVGLDNLVLAADRDFGRVRYYFHGAPPEHHFRHVPRHYGDPAAPFRWLIGRDRLGMGLR